MCQIARLFLLQRVKGSKSGDTHDFNELSSSFFSPARQGTERKFIDQIHEIILEDCPVSAKSIAEQLGISRERVGSIIHEDLDMQKLLHQTTQKTKGQDFHENLQ
jgi:predicted HTH transcriptional regulator